VNAKPPPRKPSTQPEIGETAASGARAAGPEDECHSAVEGRVFPSGFEAREHPAEAARKE
jgi:hypothetical protein